MTGRTAPPSPPPAAEGSGSGHALLLAAIVVLSLLAVVEVLLVPTDALASSGIDVLAMFALAVKSHVTLLAPTLCVQGTFIVATFVARRRPEATRWVAVLGVVAGGVCAFQSYTILVAYERFEGHGPFIAAWAALGVYLAVANLAVCIDVGRWARLGLAVLGVAGASLTTWANVTVYPGGYPTLHQSLTSVSYLIAPVGIALAASFWRVRPGGRLGRWSAPMLAGLLGLAMLAAGFASTRAVMLHRKFTLLGRAAVTEVPGVIDACVTPPEQLEQGEARAVFARHSRMPSLPSTFRLADHNVLLVTIESFRFDESFLGRRAGATPNLARLVDRGAFAFHDAMSPSAGTVQSIASMLTQTYPTHADIVLEVPRWCGELRSQATTVAEIFRASGYTTFAALHALFPAALRGGEQGVDLLWIQPDHQEAPTADTELVDWTIEAIDRARASGKRFFGWTFLISPHDPYYERHAPTASDRERFRQEIDHADAQVGRLLDHLDATGLLASTIVIITGDHGEEFMEHGNTTHSFTLHDESIHVPLVVWLPQVKGSAVTDVTSTMYVFPWLLSAGDPLMVAAADRAITSDLAPMMKAVDGAVVAELVGVERRSAALIWNDRKIMHGAYSNFVQMYDRRSDPRELHDLSSRGFPFKPELAALERYKALRACRDRATVTRRPYQHIPNLTRRDDVRRAP